MNKYLIIICIFTPMVLFALGITGIIAGHFTKREKIENLGKCLVAWNTLFFLLPGIAKKSGFIKNKLVRLAIALLAPPLLVLYGVVYGLWTSYQPLPYNKLRFTSYDEIAAITEIPDFPQFKYIRNSHDGWDGRTTTWNEFTDSMEVKRLFAYLDSLVEDKDNIYWRKDTIIDSDKEILLCTDVYYSYDRGWDGEYIKCPDGIRDSSTQVSIRIFKDGFSLIPKLCWLGGIEDYANHATLNKITGVRFPDLEFVDGYYYDYRDSGWEATAKMQRKPSPAFIKAIKSAENWTENDDGIFTFHVVDRDGDIFENITINPNSRFVKFSWSTH